MNGHLHHLHTHTYNHHHIHHHYLVNDVPHLPPETQHAHEINFQVPNNLPNQPRYLLTHNHNLEQVQDNLVLDNGGPPNVNPPNGANHNGNLLHQMPAIPHQHHPIHHHIHFHQILPNNDNAHNFNTIPTPATLEQLQLQMEVPPNDYHQHIHLHNHHHVFAHHPAVGDQNQADDDNDLHNLNFANFPPIFA